MLQINTVGLIPSRLSISEKFRLAGICRLGFPNALTPSTESDLKESPYGPYGPYAHALGHS